MPTGVFLLMQDDFLSIADELQSQGLVKAYHAMAAALTDAALAAFFGRFAGVRDGLDHFADTLEGWSHEDPNLPDIVDGYRLAASMANLSPADGKLDDSLSYIAELKNVAEWPIENLTAIADSLLNITAPTFSVC